MRPAASSPSYHATLNGDSILNDACGANIAEPVGAMLDGNVYNSAHPAGVIREHVE